MPTIPNLRKLPLAAAPGLRLNWRIENPSAEVSHERFPVSARSRPPPGATRSRPLSWSEYLARQPRQVVAPTAITPGAAAGNATLERL